MKSFLGDTQLTSQFLKNLTVRQQKEEKEKENEEKEHEEEECEETEQPEVTTWVEEDEDDLKSPQVLPNLRELRAVGKWQIPDVMWFIRERKVGIWVALCCGWMTGIAEKFLSLEYF